MGLLTDPTITDQAGVQRNFDAIGKVLFVGNGTPESVVKAGRAIYIRLDGGVGSTFYVKRTSADVATGWTAVA